MIQTFKRILPNGLRVVAVEMPHLHSAEIALYLKAGGRNDPPGKEGLSHFLEHMLFRGTAEHPTNLELETAFEAIGGSVNAATDAETTCYYSRVHPDSVAEGLRLFSSMLLSPTLRGTEIEKRIITEEALEDINEQGEEINPDNLASRLLWPGHPLGEPTIGYLHTIAGFTPEELRVHMETYYLPHNTVIAVAGKVSADDVFAAAAKAFDGWSGEPLGVTVPPMYGQSAPQSSFVKDSDSQVNLQFAFRSFDRFDPRIMAARLLRRMIAGSGSSRLHLILRERLGIVYSVDASISAYEETGCFTIDLSTAAENLTLAVEEVLAETMRLSTEPPGEDELARVRRGYFFDLEYSRDSAYEMANRYSWGELMGIWRDIEQEEAEASAVTSEAVRDTARAIFSPSGLNLVAVGPWGEAEKRGVEALLAKYREEWR